jgi:hypothetical protein
MSGAGCGPTQGMNVADGSCSPRKYRAASGRCRQCCLHSNQRRNLALKEVISRLPQVLETTVLGAPRAQPEVGRCGRRCRCCQAGHALDQHAVPAHCATAMAAFKVPCARCLHRRCRITRVGSSPAAVARGARRGLRQPLDGDFAPLQGTLVTSSRHVLSRARHGVAESDTTSSRFCKDGARAGDRTSDSPKVRVAIKARV